MMLSPTASSCCSAWLLTGSQCNQAIAHGHMQRRVAGYSCHQVSFGYLKCAPCNSRSVFRACFNQVLLLCSSAAARWTSAPVRSTCALTLPTGMQWPRQEPCSCPSASAHVHSGQHAHANVTAAVHDHTFALQSVSVITLCRRSAQAFKGNRMNLAQEVYVFHLAFSG
jgi:hypothetical protein